MDTVLDDVVPIADLKKFEQNFREESSNGRISNKTKFEYAWCLVRSQYAADIRKGLFFLEELIRTDQGEAQRDYLFYLALGNARIKEYQNALVFIDKLLSVEPTNNQAKDLGRCIKKRMDKEGLMGMAIVGGATLAVGALVGLGIALAKHK